MREELGLQGGQERRSGGGRRGTESTQIRQSRPTESSVRHRTSGLSGIQGQEEMEKLCGQGQGQCDA